MKKWTDSMNAEKGFYRHILNELNVVFDVGCRTDNIFYSLNNNLEIHLFEPMKTDEILKFGESLKDIENVYFNNFGLSSENEIKTFYLEYASLSTDWHKHLNRPKDSVELEFRTLYDYMIDNEIEKIDLLKIDTEAWDFEVMKGAREKIFEIPYIQFEAGWPIYGESDTITDIFNYFEEYNFYNIGGLPENYVITKQELPYKKIR